MSRTVTSTYTTRVSVTSSSDNPVTVATTAVLQNGLYGQNHYGPFTYWTISNYGTINAGGTYNYAITLFGGGTITNHSSGTISGDNTGILVSAGPGTVVNAGSIYGTGNGVALLGGGSATNQSGGTISAKNGTALGIDGTRSTVVNYGDISSTAGPVSEGVNLDDSGSVINQSGGTITGYFRGVYVAGHGAGPVTVVNAGYIAAIGTAFLNGFSNDGVYLGSLGAGGSVTNQSGAVITGQEGVYSKYDAATVVNAGYIHGTGAQASGIVLEAGGSVTNQSGGTISGDHYGVYLGAAGSVINQSGGTISGDDGGVYLGAAGSVTNQSGGTISGWYGIYGGTNAAVTVVNAGSITGTGTYSSGGIALEAGGSVTNLSGGTINGYRSGIYSGTIAAGTVVNAGDITGTADYYSSGISLAAGGSVTNLSGGTISGWYGIFGGTIAAVAVVNAGSITGTGTYSSGGIALEAGGSVTNLSGGTISGSSGIDISRAAGTVVNSGSITAGSGFSSRGIALGAGGYVTNESGGTISGKYGVSISGAAGYVVNSGSIIGSVCGIALEAGGYVTNLSAGTISTIYGGRTAVTVVNAGYIGETDSSYYGIGLRWGGSVTNLSGGTISGQYAVFIGTSYLGAAGTITNQSGGTISGLHGILGDPLAILTVVNAGYISGSESYGIQLKGGGSVTNQSGGTISADTNVAVGIADAPGTVVNYGDISSTGETLSQGVNLDGGGSVINQSGGTITGYYRGVSVAADVSGAVTVVNAGYIAAIGTAFLTASSNDGVFLGSFTAGGSVTNQSGAVIIGYDGIYSKYDAATVVNAGYIDGFSGDGSGIVLEAGGSVINQSGGTISGEDGGVYLGAAGSVTNQSGGTISGWDGIYGSTNAAVTVVNAGSITGTGTDTGSGIALKAGGSVTNLSGGTISGYRSGIYSGTIAAVAVVNAGSITGSGDDSSGIALEAGGSVTNLSGGTISGSRGVYISGAAGTVVNSGSITAESTFSGRGIALEAGGSVTNESGGTISSGRYGVSISGAAGYVVNSGSITASVMGIELEAGGSVTNQSGGTISGYISGIYGGTTDVTVVNAGYIGGSSYYGIDLGWGGSVTNLSGGTISGKFAVYLGAAGTITNQSGGTISGGTYALQVEAGYAARLVIDPGAVFVGIVDGGNTIGSGTNSTLELASGASGGTLSGLGSQYRNFAQTTIDAGASWTLTGTNTLASGSSFSNFGTLTLLNATLADSGVIANDGGIVIDPSSMTISSLIGTGTVTIAADSTLDLTGTVSSGETIDFASSSGALYLTPGAGGTNFAGQIDGLRTGDTIGLNGITDAKSATIVNGNTLAITTGSEGTIDLTLDPSQNFSGATFNTGPSKITANDLPCFVAGTVIDTPAGPLAVEDLRQGDLVCTASGGTRPVRWIGRRHLDLMRHPDPRLARPIRILADAIADGAPRRDLLVSPDHALFHDGGLIPARLLLNGATIRQESVPAVTYYHVELDAHDVLLAEGLPVESYLDTGNRGSFENAQAPLVLHPDFSTTNDQARRVAESCAPFIDDATRIKPVWSRMADRAIALGHPLPDMPPTTTEPALHVMADGRRIRPLFISGNRYFFALPATPNALWIVSRHATPCDLQPWLNDRRQLGVMVRQIRLRQGAELVVIPMDHPTLDEGWWAFERHAHSLLRWTNGNACVALPPGGPAMVEIELAATLNYALVQEPLPERAGRDFRGQTGPSRKHAPADNDLLMSA